MLRADSHYAAPEVFDWCRANRVDWLFGLAPNVALRRHVTALEKSTAERFKEPAPAKAGVASNRGKVRRFMQFYDAAESWNRVERIIARVEAGPEGTDTRFIVTNLPGDDWIDNERRLSFDDHDIGSLGRRVPRQEQQPG